MIDKIRKNINPKIIEYIYKQVLSISAIYNKYFSSITEQMVKFKKIKIKKDIG